MHADIAADAAFAQTDTDPGIKRDATSCAFAEDIARDDTCSGEAERGLSFERAEVHLHAEAFAGYEVRRADGQRKGDAFTGFIDVVVQAFNARTERTVISGNVAVGVSGQDLQRAFLT